MPHGPAAILFDFDGVLVNSEPMHFLALNEVLADEKIELTEDEYYRELIGFDDRGAVRVVFEKRGLALDAKTLLRVVARKSRAMRRLIQDQTVHALPGASELVRALWRDYPLGICSGALRDEIEAMLESVSLRDCFKVIVSAEDVTVGKPDPSGYLLATKQLSALAHKTLSPKDVLIVEDAPTVIAAVRAVGFQTLGVASTLPIERLSDAHHAVATLAPDEVKKKIPALRLRVS